MVDGGKGERVERKGNQELLLVRVEDRKDRLVTPSVREKQDLGLQQVRLESF